MDFVIEETNLAIVIRDVVEMLQPQSDARGLELKSVISDSEINMETDGHKLKQVLINMVSNAVKFTSEGSVTVHCVLEDAESKKVSIRVVDTGIGIKPEKINVIFEAYSQAEDTTTRDFGGTGLGLTISRNIIEQLGGTMGVTSEEGVGSTFFIDFEGGAPASNSSRKKIVKKVEKHVETPKETEALKGDDEKTPAVDNTTEGKEIYLAKDGIGALTSNTDSKEALKNILPVSPGKRILIVDDDPDAREFIGNYVKEMGADYRECGEPEKLFEVISDYKPDLVTLDIMMPQINGLELLMQMKNKPEISHISVIIISMVSDTNRNKAISLGAIDALTKPVIQSDFLNCIQRSLNSDKIVNRKILIIDDLADYQDLMKSWLNENSNVIQTASNGVEAFKVLESFIPDIIFLDLIMPVMDGLTFLKEFRSVEKYSNIPVIVVTAKDLTPEDRKWIRSRADNIFSKG